MSTTCQQIIDRAKAFSALNTPLTADRAEMLSRVRADQAALFAAAADAASERFQVTGTITSNTGSSGRIAALTGLSVPVGRVLKVVVNGAAMATAVDVRDQDAHFPPRYIPRAQTLVEVANDWDTVTAAAVTLTVTYVQAPTDIDPTGLASQVVSVPDEWCDLLVMPLAMYLHQKDPGRDPAEYERLERRLLERRNAFDLFLTRYAGDVIHVPADKRA